MIVALTKTAREEPSAASCIQFDALLSCLHLVAAVIPYQFMSDIDSLITVLEDRGRFHPIDSAARVAKAIRETPRSQLVTEIVDLHGTQNIQTYLTMVDQVQQGLMDAVSDNVDLEIIYFGSA